MTITSRPKHSSPGYTLIEALVVVAIVGLISLVTVPNFISYLRSAKIKSAVRNFASDMREARQLAVSEHRRVMVSFGTAGNEIYHYWIYRDMNGTWELTANGEHSLEPETGDAAKTVSFAAFPSDGFKNVPGEDGTGRVDLFYLPNGSVSSDGISPSVPTTSTVVVQTSAEVPKKLYTFNISLAGNLKVQ
ncbi:MAG: type II secretion system protein [Thermoanaerobaculia bacterium]